jgi:hypothetical protein
MCGDGLGDDLCPGLRTKTGESEKEDSQGQAAQAEHELAEVLVGGEQDAGFSVGQVEHGVVADAGSKFGDGCDVVTVGAQAGDGRSVDALVSEELHATDLDSG